MKYIFLIFYSIILQTVSLHLFLNKQIEPNLCINCQYFIDYGPSDIYGKCSLFRKFEFNNNYLIDGIEDMNKDASDFYFCSTARSNNFFMCGTKGKKYVIKYVK
jgi:hypothetical protein